jgi:hypothetical protein
MTLRYVYKHDIDGLLSVGNTQKKMEIEVLSSLETVPIAHMVAREKKKYLIFILKKAYELTRAYIEKLSELAMAYIEEL